MQDFYLAENRIYSGYDATLKTGPYNFGCGNTRPDWVERFPYQNGLLVWFANGEYTDNNTIRPPRWRRGAAGRRPPGAGQLLRRCASLLGNRRQPFDATFGQEATDAVTFHRNGVATDGRRRSPAIPTFDDSDVDRYWTADEPVELHQGGRFGHVDDGHARPRTAATSCR